MIVALLLQVATIGTADTIAVEPTRDLANRTFAVVPTGIVSHEVRSDRSLPTYFSIDFYTAAEPFGDGLCHRHVYSVGGAEVGGGAAPKIEHAQLALAPDCATVSTTGFASVQPADAIDDAAIMVRWLADRQTRRDPVAVTCLRSAYKPNPCAKDPIATLWALPLDRIYIINKGAQPGEWAFAIMPNGPGQLFYDVRVSKNWRGAEAVTIAWEAPAPF